MRVLWPLFGGTWGLFAGSGAVLEGFIVAAERHLPVARAEQLAGADARLHATAQALVQELWYQDGLLALERPSVSRK